MVKVYVLSKYNGDGGYDVLAVYASEALAERELSRKVDEEVADEKARGWIQRETKRHRANLEQGYAIDEFELIEEGL